MVQFLVGALQPSPFTNGPAYIAMLYSLEHLFTCWDIIILLCYLNASIYLVKGGRLGLSPSVLFHSCRPSFCHTGVMFPDFCVPYAVGL